MAYLKLGQPDQALTDYDEALKLNPNAPAALYGRGVARLMKGEVEASNADFELAKGIKPSVADPMDEIEKALGGEGGDAPAEPPTGGGGGDD